jgi:hypothetical protein
MPESTVPELTVPQATTPQPAAPEGTPVRAALLAMTPNGEVRTAFVFWYTPTRMVRERERGGQGVSETFTIPFSLDCAEAIAAGDAGALERGLHPALALLDQVFRETWLLLSWGKARTIPMSPQSMTVIETEFDSALNPIRAEVTLQAQRITVTSDANLGRYVNAGAGVAAKLAKLYDGGPVPEIEL